MSWSNIYVPGEGPTHAKIVIVGEAPGATEERDRRPFCGGAGNVLNGLLRDAGLDREDIYITNVVKYRPKGNDFTVFYEDKQRKVRTAFLDEQIKFLQDEILDISPNIVIPMGGEALRAITDRRGITNWRGSILDTMLGKAIPTYHPAAILRRWAWRPIALLDLEKAKEESLFPEVTQMRRELITGNTIPYNSLIAKLKKMARAEFVAFDIETAVDQITCISFADRPYSSLCVPFWFDTTSAYWSEEKELHLWELVKEILEGPSKKIAQNAQFDMYWLAQHPYNIKVNNLYHDTMIAAHTLWPELPKGLDFLCSIYTDHPFYKDMIKTEDSRKYFEYNALDSCITFEVAQKQRTDMNNMGVAKFYSELPNRLTEPFLDMTMRGVKIDLDLLAVKKKNYKDIIADEQKALEEMIGHELNVNSPKQMKEYIYDELKLPKKYKNVKKDGSYKKTLTTDEDALNSLYIKHKIPALKTILSIREARKIYSTYLDIKMDKDKRIRTVYDITGTETGRLASRTTAKGTGMNLQNVPVSMRDLFIPDEGKVFVSADLSQAEARVVAYIAGDTKLIDVFNSGGDIHKRNAANIFGVDESRVTKEQRQLAKKVVHASHYGMGPRKFAQIAGVPEKEAKILLNKYFATYPKLKIWHLQVAETLRKSRCLTTPLGRKRLFCNSWNDDLLKEAYAFVPQSTVSDILNMGLLSMYDYINGHNLDMQIMLQVHDSVTLQCPVDMVCDARILLKTSLERPIRVNSEILTIPVDIQIGENWGDCK